MESLPTRLLTPQHHPAQPPLLRSAALARQVRIRNKQYGTYMYEANHQLMYCGPSDANAACYWRMEDFGGGHKRFANRATGHYISIEHQYSCVESIPVKDCWLSACWTLESISDGFLIRSVWHNWHILHIDVQDGYVQYGGALLNQAGAVWILDD